MSGSGIRVRSKVWLEIDGEPLLGSGREELLRLVRECGSINAAAARMGIGYRKAWTAIDAMEKRLGFPLVDRRRGGHRGGESALTTEATDLLEKYDRLTEGVREAVDAKFAEIFK